MKRYTNQPTESKPRNGRASLPGKFRPGPRNFVTVPYNQHFPPRWAKLTCWRHSDYRELFVFVGLTSRGCYFNIKHLGRILTRDFILGNDPEATHEAAKRMARAWVKENAPGAVLRFRRIVERAEIDERRRAA